MEEIFINPENGQVGKYSIRLYIYDSKNIEKSLLSIGFYLDYFSKNLEIAYIKQIIEKELNKRDITIFDSSFSISSDNFDIFEIFKSTHLSYERALTILSVFSFYLQELDLAILKEAIKSNENRDIVHLIINLNIKNKNKNP